MARDRRPFHVQLCDRCMRRFERHVVGERRLNELDEWLDAICPNAAQLGFCLARAMEAESAAQD